MSYDSTHYKTHSDEYNNRRNKYRKKNLKRIPLDVQNEWYDILKIYCDENNIPVSAFIKNACEQVAEQNGFQEFIKYHEEKKKRDNIESIAHDNIESITPATTQAMSDENTKPATTPESEVPNDVPTSQSAVLYSLLEQ